MWVAQTNKKINNKIKKIILYFPCVLFSVHVHTFKSAPVSSYIMIIETGMFYIVL